MDSHLLVYLKGRAFLPVFRPHSCLVAGVPGAREWESLRVIL